MTRVMLRRDYMIFLSDTMVTFILDDYTVINYCCYLVAFMCVYEGVLQYFRGHYNSYKLLA